MSLQWNMQARELISSTETKGKTMKLISEYWDDNSQVMGDDTLVEVARSFEIDTEREVDRYVSVEVRCGVEALNSEGVPVTDPDEVAELHEEWLGWSDERDKAQRYARVGWSMSAFMHWANENPEPIRYVWDSCETWATKESLDDEYKNGETYYGESYSERYFTNEADALEHARRYLRTYEWERDFSF